MAGSRRQSETVSSIPRWRVAASCCLPRTKALTALEVSQYPVWAAREEGPDLEMIRLLAFLLPFLAELESLFPVLSINSVVNEFYSPLTN
jgi:hypothetical protein